MRPRSSPSGAALLFGAAASVLYAATLSRHPTADSLLRAIAIEGGGPNDVIGWRHPLLDALMWGFVELWRRLGWTGGALLLLQAVNALAGGICVAVLHHLVAQLTGSWGIAASVAAGFAVSGGMWLLSTEAELVTPALAAGLFVLDRVIALSEEEWARRGMPLAIGLAIGAITALYPTNLSLLPVALLAACPGGARRLRAWAPRAAGLAVGALLPIVAGVALLARAAVAPLAWVAALGDLPEREGYRHLAWFNVPHGAYAVVRSLLLYPGLGMNDSTREFLAAAAGPARVRFAAYYTVAAGLAAVAPLGAVARWRALRSASARPIMLLTTWAACNAAFAFAWVPGDVSFWMPVLCFWWLLIALLLATTRARRRMYAVTAVALTAAALLSINGMVFILPRHDLRRNRQYAIAAGVAARTAPADVVVTHYDDLLALYLRYFARRAVVIADRRDASRAVSTALAQARASGGRVFVVDIATPAQPLPLTAVPLEDIAESPFWEATNANAPSSAMGGGP